MSIAELWMEPKIGTAVQVRAAFKEALAPEVFDEIEDIDCAYNMMDDAVEFLIKRKRDGARVKLPLMRQWLDEPIVSHTVRAIHKDPQMLSKLILFLA